SPSRRHSPIADMACRRVGDAAATGRPPAPPGVSPLVSVVTPVYDTPPDVLAACMASVREQDGDWEHVLVDDASPAPHVASLLDAAAEADPRIRVVRRARNGGIAEASNAGLRAATGRFVALLDHDDQLATGVVAAVSKALVADDTIDYLYTDEDHLTEAGSSFLPVYKPDWSPERFRSHMYTNHLPVLSRELALEAGGFRREFEGSQDYDLILRVTERARQVRHLPIIGYHWRMGAGSAAANPDAKPYAFAAGLHAVQAHCDRVGLDATVEMLPWPGYHRLRRRLAVQPTVSVVIPTAGSSGLVWGAERYHVVDAVRS